MDEIEIIQRLTDVDNRSKSNTHRLDRLEALTDSIHSLTQSVALMAQKQDATAEKLDGLSALYAKGNKVTHGGKTWVSLVDNNCWEPGIIGTELVWREV